MAASLHTLGKGTKLNRRFHYISIASVILVTLITARCGSWLSACFTHMLVRDVVPDLPEKTVI